MNVRVIKEEKWMADDPAPDGTIFVRPTSSMAPSWSPQDAICAVSPIQPETRVVADAIAALPQVLAEMDALWERARKAEAQVEELQQALQAAAQHEPKVTYNVATEARIAALAERMYFEIRKDYRPGVVMVEGRPLGHGDNVAYAWDFARRFYAFGRKS